MRKVLKKEFYARPPDTVAKDLLGKFLVRDDGKVPRALMITETEAYFGEEDKASHARFGRTGRSRIMYDEPGTWYVYLIYGMYWMLNAVTGKTGHPSAVLIRGVEGLNGPGKLTRELGIGRSLNGEPARKDKGLWIEDRGMYIPGEKIEKCPRIGVSYAGAWAEKPYRFIYRS